MRDIRSTQKAHTALVTKPLPDPANIDHLEGEDDTYPGWSRDTAFALGQGANGAGSGSAEADRIGARPLILTGFVIIALFFGAGLLWAGFAPLSSAAISPGVVSVAGNRKTIQHLEGGIIQEILVREGQSVSAGQALVRLDRTRAQATLAPLRARFISLAALEARLLAELRGSDTIEFSDELLDLAHEPEVQRALAGQMDIFESQKIALDSRADIMAKQIAQLGEQIKGYQGEIGFQEKQLSLIEDELTGIRGLAEQGLIKRSRLLGLEREMADLEGARVHNRALIASARQNTQEVRMRMVEYRNDRAKEVSQELREVQSQLAELRERIPAARDALQRTTITAPLDGIVVKLQVHTIGGVIGAGKPILDIVPSNERLVIDARVDPKDRDVIHAGLPAEVRFPAFNRRNSMPVRGEVLSISADRLTDGLATAPYYLARIELKEDPAQVAGGGSVHPGMQADVLIITGKRTALSYLFRPFMRSFDRSLRED